MTINEPTNEKLIIGYLVNCEVGFLPLQGIGLQLNVLPTPTSTSAEMKYLRVGMTSGQAAEIVEVLQHALQDLQGGASPGSSH
jgi:hypothetical protein